MLFGAAGMSGSMVILAVNPHRSLTSATSSLLAQVMSSIGGKGPGIVAALFLFLFNTFFAIGWLGMTW